MRNIHVNDIIKAVAKLCKEANYYLSNDIERGLKKGIETEVSPKGKEVLGHLIENAQISKTRKMPICQDTGMAVVFMDIGQDVHIVGGNITDAVNEGVRRGYNKGFLRKSVVGDPILERVNTGDNTPAIIHYNITDGNKIKITMAPKGFGSENMSQLRMFTPSEGAEGVKKFIIEVVDQAGPNPCPPIIVGVGIGGTMEKAAFLAKKALLRPIDVGNQQAQIKKMEDELLENINRLGIGPAGLGGRLTALAVNIEVFPTHIAGLPVAVNIGCHATRHAEVLI
ncbi:MAG: fumarate hydratase [Clostridium sp.]|nr:fumarate hydratase [Clostridium sp.]